MPNYTQNALRLSELTEHKSVSTINIDHEIAIALAGFGIIEEVGEVIAEIDNFQSKSKLIKELGDVLYYVVCLSHKFGIDYYDLRETVVSRKRISLNKSAKNLTMAAFKLSGRMKRYERGDYSDDLGSELKLITQLTEILTSLVIAVAQIGDEFSVTLTEIEQINIEKLDKRLSKKCATVA